MRVVLKVTSGAYEGRRVLLQSGQSIKVGRTEWSDFVVSIDDRMSGVHFSLTCEERECRVRDLASTNGTFVNDARVTETAIIDGDRIFAGRTNFQVAVEISESIVPLVMKLPASVQAQAAPDEVAETTRATNLTAAEPRAPTAAVAPVTVNEQPTISPALAIVSNTDRPYTKGLQDPDSSVRRAVLHAAAWTRQKWLLNYCRYLARQPAAENWEALYLLAILGQPGDLEAILTIGRTKSLGSRRFAVYAACGHPRGVRDLLIELENKDPNTAVAAGVAFTKITGAAIDSEQRVVLQPENGDPSDEIAQDFLDEASLPSPHLAHAHWKENQDALVKGRRWRRGVEISHPLENNLLDSLDLEARWQARLRIQFEGQARLSPVDSALQLSPSAAT